MVCFAQEVYNRSIACHSTTDVNVLGLSNASVYHVVRSNAPPGMLLAVKLLKMHVSLTDDFNNFVLKTTPLSGMQVQQQCSAEHQTAHWLALTPDLSPGGVQKQCLFVEA